MTVQLEWKQVKTVKFSNFLNISSWKLTPYQILSLGFFSLILVGAFLLMLPVATISGEITPFIDALFTATSAVCVTGLVVLDTGKHYSLFGQIVIILLIQIGAWGIMTMAALMAILMRKRIQLRNRIIMQEALNQLTFSGIVKLTLYIIRASLVIEFIGGTFLAIRFYQDFGMQGIYFGYWHAISTFCNAGFDVLGSVNSSFIAYVDDIVINLTVTTLIVLGGLGFYVLADVWQNKKIKLCTLQTRVVLSTTALLIFFGTIGIFCLEYHNAATLGNLSFGAKVFASYFQAISARTAGCNTVPINSLGDASLFFVVLLMFIGASPGSTGGGIKTTTFAVIASSIWGILRGDNQPYLFYRRIPEAMVYKAFAIFFTAAALVAFVTMMLCISEKFSFIKILFEVVSAFSTTGLSAGITPDLTSHGKIWIIITMFVGRVGPVTFALALALRSKKRVIEYPEGKITIG